MSDAAEFSDALAGWGLTPTQIGETLEGTEFGLGLIELRAAPQKPSQGIAIVVADRRDDELRELFAWRERVSDEVYAQEWEVGEAPATRVILGPDEQALTRFAVSVQRPIVLERRFLFSVAPVAALLAKLQIAGTALWLVAASAIEAHAAREGPTDSYDLAGRSLRAGVLARPIPSIDEALAHVGAPRETAAARPMNRAQRRAAGRGKRKP